MTRAHARVKALNALTPSNDGNYVLYWMQHSQRATDNPALEHAAARANECGKPLKVLFVVDPTYPEANARHYTFMLEGIAETKQAVERRGIHFALRLGSPPEIAAAEARNASVAVTDRGYLRHLAAWRDQLAEDAPCLAEMVEGDVIVPVEAASDKLESAARTIRRKLHDRTDEFATLPDTVTLEHKAKGLDHADDRAIDDVAAFIEALEIDASVGPVDGFKGGTRMAMARLKAFADDALDAYGEGRSDIVNRNVSHLSPYLHFGQISPVTIYRAVKASGAGDDDKAGYVDEMLVRRELAVNFVHYNKDYDSVSGLPGWARDTLEAHASDERPAVFTASEMEHSKTDDPYWNAAMREMRLTGYLHNHLRMYWGKRIITYTNTPGHAYRTALALNNKYLLDGRDCNSYANVGWLFGVHDRGWPEREIFGKVRSMTPGGLKRKFDVDGYVKWANAL
ncbi:deoxyribodipyrimidine photo-lyase [Acuticoccus sp. MNP-M23]|uniref:deoxyribodipyrimidine photo-lyase n=1 Tax=Acuticoccus sp. MNP-M23 TaxID=3072793 RepID=UPI0028168993|nr:deoxyribodipyrimidine photo-lyase [Acuticoccus sp. MNP-M23]WMS42089.1 deoxyribodipyrimidine photo-lyase [Acuticoccus sp. MNP-M23]